eukprot:4553122-Pyramimonas_sp.AAC.1
MQEQQFQRMQEQQQQLFKALAASQRPAAKETPAGSETGDDGEGGLSRSPTAVRNRNRRRNQAERKRQQSAEPTEDLEGAKRPRPAKDQLIIDLVSSDDEPQQEFNGRPLDPHDLRWKLMEKAAHERG